MLERLYFLPDIMERYGVSETTARRYMKQMRRLRKPFAVPESAIREWENARMVEGSGMKKTSQKRPQKAKDGHIIPRVRAG